MLNRKLPIVALAGMLFLLIASGSAGAQNRAHADLKDSKGKTIGSAASASAAVAC
jgi:hypothetical protein